MKYFVLAWIHTTDFIHRLMKEEKGASAIEYVLIAAVIVAAVTTMKTPLTQAFTTVTGNLTSAVASSAQ
ncbi:Flp family type IVb pilin [Photobacterium sp. Hal280]|uniref:Flp family type IVb pilin n=1 Tax=Photobacterium sp. Hal280 TaxID=3035163 RepID=UPI00301BD541